VKRALALAIALALCAGRARAEPAPEPDPAGMAAGDQQAQLDLFVNGDQKETALVVLRASDILVAVEDLQRSGLDSVPGTRIRIAGRDMVSLRSLSPKIEFSFDERGNLISVDNDGDYPGESERVVYLPWGSETGWRSTWQYGKYTDPKNNKYNVWIDEGMFKPRFDGRTAHTLAPIANWHAGPSGMAYNPGTALSDAWKNHFFVTSFVGSASTARRPRLRLMWAIARGALSLVSSVISTKSSALRSDISRTPPDGVKTVNG